MTALALHRLWPLLLALAIAIVGCSSTRYTTIRHPLHVGQVDPNTVPFEAAAQERSRGLPPGTLVDQARLTEVTPERVCAQVSLWSLDQVDPTRADYNNFRVALLNDQENVEVDQAQIQLEAPQTQAFQGHIAQRVRTGARRVCNGRRNGRCVAWRTVPVFRTVYRPHVWRVTDHPATVCFPNGGFVTPSTTHVSLELDARGPERMIFEWQFESAVQGEPQPQASN